jgi:hypothetical protein
VKGKKAIATPGVTSGMTYPAHTNDFFTFEEYQSDKGTSEQYPDCKINQISLTLPAQGEGNISVDIVGVGTRNLLDSGTTPTAPALTSATDPTTTSIVGRYMGLYMSQGH